MGFKQVGFPRLKMGFQAIEDRFQQRPIQGSVLTLLDFSKAYDIVWQENLLLCILDAGISISFIRWLRSFLTDRRACMQLHNICSSSRHFNQGLPQGSVPAPLLFLFYINNLVENVSNDALISLLADDVSILKTVRIKRRLRCNSPVRRQ